MGKVSYEKRVGKIKIRTDLYKLWDVFGFEFFVYRFLNVFWFGLLVFDFL